MDVEWTTFEGPAGQLACWTLEDSSTEEAVPVLFVHPINLQGICWVEVARRISGRKVLMPDLRGHGGSTPNGPFGLDEWTADCVATLDHFDVERAHVVGGSLGGPLAANLASEMPDRVASISSFGGALRIEGAEPEEVLETLRRLGPKGMFRSVLPEISVGPEIDPITMEWILALTNPNDVDTVYAVWQATLEADIGSIAGSVECPVLISNGQYDETCTIGQGERMADAFGTTLRVLPGVGHLPMCEAPLLVALLVREHIAVSEASDPPSLG